MLWSDSSGLGLGSVMVLLIIQVKLILLVINWNKVGIVFCSWQPPKRPVPYYIFKGLGENFKQSILYSSLDSNPKASYKYTLVFDYHHVHLFSFKDSLSFISPYSYYFAMRIVFQIAFAFLFSLF